MKDPRVAHSFGPEEPREEDPIVMYLIVNEMLGMSIGKEDTKQKISQSLTGKFLGEKAPSSKLSDQQRLEIIKLSDDGLTQRVLSKMFNISQWSIFNVLKNRLKYENKV
jgi:hypothetical protein